MRAHLTAFSLLLAASLAAAAKLPIEALIRAGSGPYSYDPAAADGPPNWATIDPAFSTCGSGTSQSPINYPCQGSSILDLLDLDEGPAVSTAVGTFSYSTTTSNFALSCSSSGSCGSTDFEGTTYNLINIHFHSPSEHTIGGVQYPLEAHMVHQSGDGSLLVIGTMFSDGSQDDCITTPPSGSGSNSMFQSILNGITNGNTAFSVDTSDIVDNTSQFYTYDGSLTTPPCSEGVTWQLSTKRQTISPAQVSAYLSATGSTQFGNARPVQPLNGRQIKAFKGLVPGLLPGVVR